MTDETPTLPSDATVAPLLADYYETITNATWKTSIANSLPEFIEIVLGISGTGFSIEPDHYVLYRGQESIRWPLLPKLYREYGHPSIHYRNLEETALYRFSTLIFSIRDWQMNSEWHAHWLDLFVGHHFGLTTRLLDWTSNPLAALWFAVSGSNNNVLTDDGVVYCLDTHDLDDIGLADHVKEESPFDTREALIFQAPEVTKRINAQDSYFTSHSCDLKTGIPRLVEDRVDEGINAIRIQIPRKEFASIRHQLDQLSINESRIFPDIAGIVRHVNWIQTQF